MLRTRLSAIAFCVPLLVAVPFSIAHGGKIQFGLAELPDTVDPHGDSLVVTIPGTETALLAHARALVAWYESGGDPLDSPGAMIVVAQIAPGADGLNRNYLAPGEPPWSWHAVGTPSFSDFTMEILDGWPTFVEQDVEGWIANTNGYIGFWGYTVAAELGSFVPEPSSPRLAFSMLVAVSLWVANARSGPVYGRRF